MELERKESKIPKKIRVDTKFTTADFLREIDGKPVFAQVAKPSKSQDLDDLRIMPASTAVDAESRITDLALKAIVATRPLVPLVAQKQNPKEKKPKKEEKKENVTLEFVRIPSGFFIESRMQIALQFETLVKFAEQVLIADYTIFGSFIHYLVWCLETEQDPPCPMTIKNYLGAGFTPPTDLDILDPRGTLLKSKTIPLLQSNKVVTLKNTDLEYTLPDGTVRQKPIPGHTKHKLTIHGMIPVEIQFDLVKKKDLVIDALDFNVNRLVFSNKHGLQVGGKHNSSCKSMLCKLRNASLLHESITGILTRDAIFMSEFPPGPHQITRRKMLISRIKKMLIRKWHILNWDEEYPTVQITNLDSIEYKTCKICSGISEVGDKLHLMMCNGTISNNGICEDCFWKLLNSAADEGRYVKCPFCREKRLIFGTREQLQEQRTTRLKDKQSSLAGRHRANEPAARTTNEEDPEADHDDHEANEADSDEDHVRESAIQDTDVESDLEDLEVE